MCGRGVGESRHHRWRIPASYEPGMRVPGIIFADERLLQDIARDQAPQQE